MTSTTYLAKTNLDFSKNTAQFIERPHTNEELVDYLREVIIFLDKNVARINQIDKCYVEVMDLLCKLS